MKTVIESLERRVLLDGTLDTTYNGTGIVTQQYRATNDAVAMAFQDDGKQVVAGETQAAGAGKDILLTRYNTDGTLDTAFGTSGVATLDLGADDIATVVKIQGDGKIVAAGTTGDTSGATGDGWVARWNGDGKLDTTFNKTGYRIVDFGGTDAISGLLIGRVQSSTASAAISGRAALTAPQYDYTFAGASANLLSGTSGIALGKLFDDGSYDTRFGGLGTGLLVTSPGIGTFEGATSLSRYGSRLLVSGFSVAALTQAVRFMIASFDCDCGDFDDTFGDGGRAFVSFGNNVELAMAAQYDPFTNSIYAAGTTGDGLTELPGGVAKPSLGLVANSARFAIARLLVNGTLDTTFNGTGTNTLDFPGAKAGASGLAIEGDGRVLVGGGGQVTSTGQSNFVFGRFNVDGTLDQSFGNLGRLTEDLGASDGAFRIFLGPDNKVYAIGHTKTNATNGRLAILRYLIASAALGPVPALFAVSNLRRMAAPLSGTLNYKVRLMHAPTSLLSLHYQTRDGLSLAGQDYDATSGDLTFQPGERVKMVPITYHDSHGGANPGSFYLDLSSASGGAKIANPSGIASLRFLAPNLNALQVQSVTPLNLPSSIIGGQKGKAFVNVVVKNTGTSMLRGASLINVYGSTDRTLDTMTDRLLGKLNTKIALAANAMKTYKVPVTFPLQTADTSYYFLGNATGIGVTTAATNFARSDSRLLITKPTITLIGVSTPHAPMTFGFGQKGNITFQLTNVGSVLAAGTATINLDITLDGTESTLRYFFFPKTTKINIKPGGTATISMKITAPAASTGLQARDYVMLVRLTSTKLLYKNTSDGSQVSSFGFTLH